MKGKKLTERSWAIRVGALRPYYLTSYGHPRLFETRANARHHKREYGRHYTQDWVIVRVSVAEQ